METSANVVVSIGRNDQSIVVARPHVQQHQPHCVQLESFGLAQHEMHMAEMGFKQELALMEAERLQAMAEFEVLDLENLTVTLESIGMNLDMDKEISERIEFELQEEMVRLEKELQRLEEIRR
jgi:hypothetical protein